MDILKFIYPSLCSLVFFFQVLTIIGKAICLWTFIYKYLCRHVFVCLFWGSHIFPSGSDGKGEFLGCMISHQLYKRSCHAFIQSGGTHSHSHQPCIRVPVALYAHVVLVIFNILNFRYFSWLELFCCGFNFHFPDD